jgi:hypothetical protein
MWPVTKPSRKPIKWVGSAKRDLDAMPEDDFDVWQGKQGAR